MAGAARPDLQDQSGLRAHGGGLFFSPVWFYGFYRVPKKRQDSVSIHLFTGDALDFGDSGR
jgi:hypothetical protein